MTQPGSAALASLEAEATRTGLHVCYTIDIWRMKLLIGSSILRLLRCGLFWLWDPAVALFFLKYGRAAEERTKSKVQDRRLRHAASEQLK